MSGSDARLTLASASPRRQALLRERGVVFDVVAPHVDESTVHGLDPVARAVDLARRKAAAVALRAAPGYVIGADTVVWLEGEAYGKPADRADARRILTALAGRTHHVTTGYAVIRTEPRLEKTGHATARVTLRRLEAGDLDALVSSGECDDKAGALSLQGAAGAFVTCVEGRRDTVIGLPVDEVLDALRELGWHNPAG